MRINTLVFAALAGAVLAGVVRGQDDVNSDINRDTDRRLDALEKENAALRERLDAVEGGSLEAEVDDLADEGLGLNIILGKGTTRGTFQFFGDVGFAYLDPAREESQP